MQSEILETYVASPCHCLITCSFGESTWVGSTSDANYGGYMEDNYAHVGERARFQSLKGLFRVIGEKKVGIVSTAARVLQRRDRTTGPT